MKGNPLPFVGLCAFFAALMFASNARALDPAVPDQTDTNRPERPDGKNGTYNRQALEDDTHADEQRARYAARRTALWAALASAGWAIEHSEAGLYLWASRPASKRSKRCRSTRRKRRPRGSWHSETRR